MFNLFGHCRKDEISFDIVDKRQQCRSIVDFVESTVDFVEKIVRLVAFDHVASTVLQLVWTGL